MYVFCRTSNEWAVQAYNGGFTGENYRGGRNGKCSLSALSVLTDDTSWYKNKIKCKKNSNIA